MNIVYKDVLLVSFVMACAELLKITGINKKIIPIFNMALGMILGVFLINSTNIVDGIFQGAVVGLIATGTFSTGKNTSEGIKQ